MQYSHKGKHTLQKDKNFVQQTQNIKMEVHRTKLCIAAMFSLGAVLRIVVCVHWQLNKHEWTSQRIKQLKA